MYKRITQLRTHRSQQKTTHGGYFRLFGQNDDLIDQYGKKLDEIEQNVRLQQSEASLAAEVCGNLSDLFPKRKKFL